MAEAEEAAVAAEEGTKPAEADTLIMPPESDATGTQIVVVY